MVQVEPVDVERHDAAAVAARGNEPAAPCERREGFRKQFGIADVLEHHVDAAPFGDAQHLGREVLTAIVDAGLGAEIEADLHALVGAGGRDHFAAEIARRLHAGTAEAAGRAHHQHPFARLELGAIAQQVERGRRMARDHGRGREIEAVRDEPGARGRDLHIFRVAAPGVHAEEPRRLGGVALADPQRGDHAVADLAVGHARADRQR